MLYGYIRSGPFLVADSSANAEKDTSDPNRDKKRSGPQISAQRSRAGLPLLPGSSASGVPRARRGCRSCMTSARTRPLRAYSAKSKKSVTRDRALRANGGDWPPFTRLKCLHTMFMSPIGAPDARSAAFTACFSASVISQVEATSRADAPTEMRATA